MNRNSLLALPLLAAALPASAAPGDLYDCRFKPGHRDLIAEQVMLFIEDGSGDARVYDGIIHNAIGGWQDAELVEKTANKIAVKWTVLVTSGSQTARLSFRMANFLKNDKATISVRAMGYTNQDNARGACTKRRADN